MWRCLDAISAISSHWSHHANPMFKAWHGIVSRRNRELGISGAKKQGSRKKEIKWREASSMPQYGCRPPTHENVDAYLSISPLSLSLRRYAASTVATCQEAVITTGCPPHLSCIIRWICKTQCAWLPPSTGSMLPYHGHTISSTPPKPHRSSPLPCAFSPPSSGIAPLEVHGSSWLRCMF